MKKIEFAGITAELSVQESPGPKKLAYKVLPHTGSFPVTELFNLIIEHAVTEEGISEPEIQLSPVDFLPLVRVLQDMWDTGADLPSEFVKGSEVRTLMGCPITVNPSMQSESDSLTVIIKELSDTESSSDDFEMGTDSEQSDSEEDQVLDIDLIYFDGTPGLKEVREKPTHLGKLLNWDDRVYEVVGFLYNTGFGTPLLGEHWCRILSDNYIEHADGVRLRRRI
jgi:hypothetical protein